MHYYQFNIGDYASHTRGLSLLEDLAYRRMIDEYFLGERPFNGCSTDVARQIGFVQHAVEVEYVLQRFFIKTDCGYAHERIEKDLKEYKDKQEKNSKAGKASAAARINKGVSTSVQQAFSERATDVQPTSNHKPITNNQSIGTNVPMCPYEKITAAYDLHCPMLPAIVKLTDKRKKLIKASWLFFLDAKNKNPITGKPWATDAETGVTIFNKFFEAVGKSDFLSGRTADKNGKPFTGCGIEWLMNETNFLKVLEGNYKNTVQA